MGIIQKQRGVAAVEMGIVLIPLVFLAFGITEFGRAIHQYNTLTKATRNAARFLSARGPGESTSMAAAMCLTAYGKKDCKDPTPGSPATDPPLVPNLKAAMVSICDSSNCLDHLNQPTGSNVINLVTVTITGYPFTSLVPFLVPSITFGPISTTMWQVL